MQNHKPKTLEELARMANAAIYLDFEKGAGEKYLPEPRIEPILSKLKEIIETPIEETVNFPSLDENPKRSRQD